MVIDITIGASDAHAGRPGQHPEGRPESDDRDRERGHRAHPVAVRAVAAGRFAHRPAMLEACASRRRSSPCPPPIGRREPCSGLPPADGYARAREAAALPRAAAPVGVDRLRSSARSRCRCPSRSSRSARSCRTRRSAGPGTGMRFIWLTEGVTFRTPREVLRFLYCHEWMHVYGDSRAPGGPGSGRRRATDSRCATTSGPPCPSRMPRRRCGGGARASARGRRDDEGATPTHPMI